MRENAYHQRAGVLLRGLGMQPYRRGYAYLACAIALTAEGIAERGKLPEKLYPAVAERCGATPAAVERTVRNAIWEIWREGDPAARKALFSGGTVLGRKIPSSAAFVRILAQSLLRTWEQES